MKSMLYVGATLMIGASIYGFVDYRQTHDKKEFREMYSEKKTTAPVATPVKEELKTAEPEKTAGIVSKKTTVKKKALAKTGVLNPISPIAEEDKMITSEKGLTDEPVAQPEPAKESTAVKTLKKKKIRKEFFSRGRMPEEKVLIEPVKKETKKTESKEL